MLSGPRGWIKRLAANPLTWYVIIAAVLLLVIVHHLGIQPAGFSPAEKAAQTSSQNIKPLINNPVNAPHNLLAYGLHSAGLGWKSALRLSSAIFGAVFIFCFYLIVRAWFSGPIGLMGSLLLAATPLFLISARQGSPEIMYFSTVTVLAAYLWTARNQKKHIFFIFLIAIAGLALYTPGLIWWLFGGLAICWRKLLGIIEEISSFSLVLGFALLALIITPLAVAIIKDWTLIKQLALIPSHFESPINTMKHLAWMTLAIFVRAPFHTNLLLGRLPVLNLVQDALLAFGTFALWSAAKAKLLTLVIVVGFAILAAGLNNNVSLLALGIPALAVIICAGLRYLFIEWRSVFPRNPLARSLALSLMWAIVIVQLLFGIRYAVIAWPNTVDTKSTYVLK